MAASIRAPVLMASGASKDDVDTESHSTVKPFVPRRIVVCGVTGTQGSSVAKVFSQIPNWKVTGLTRNIESRAARELADLGVKLVQADLDEPSTLVHAGPRIQDGRRHLRQYRLLCTDEYPNSLELLSSRYAGKPLNQACMEHEIQQGKNIIDAASQVVAEGAPLTWFIQSTLSHASQRSNGAVNHFVEQYLRSRPKLASKARYLQVGYYMSNILNPILQPRKASDGVYEFHWPNVAPGTVLTAVSPENDTGVFVRELVRDEPGAEIAEPGTILLGEGDPMTVEQFLQVWSSVTGKRSRLAAVDTKEFIKLVDSQMPSFDDEFADNFRYYRDFGYTGGDERIKRPADFGIKGGELTSYRRYLEKLSIASLGVSS